MADKKSQSRIYSYQAPVIFIGIFYLILAGWILFSLTYLEKIFTKLQISTTFGFVMVIFIIILTCYFALGISYKIQVTKNGDIRLTSLRKVINTSTEVVFNIEGPRLPIGFLRFRLQKEKAYLFYVANQTDIQAVLKTIRLADADINFKHLDVPD
ncbi:MAG: hypothetical protein HN580_25985 [Deltaproteobacteria bacterium]|jgi:hypothetical protein|nr:hypothetical protein [Deltaproteobacteria bacterium]MBT4263620.1 hypothetical protein [Deltaproteobacteria bacterium]MBT4644050.1 hypothetical protein [Deltaproteobacteria bacterium]MBT6503653.1 hypothetical protein [Deltaproteobacteria bacterium]MBT6615348.1 hypothetical protein [Deltaproteobacteria bacterium]